MHFRVHFCCCRVHFDRVHFRCRVHFAVCIPCAFRVYSVCIFPFPCAFRVYFLSPCVFSLRVSVCIFSLAVDNLYAY